MEILHFLLRILLRLEKRSVETAGTLPVRLEQSSTETSDSGLIMAEEGRVCWASSPRSPHRLSDLLIEASGISKGQIEKVFQFCRRTGKPLGEHMVTLGILTRNQLREALVSHSTSALLSLGRLVEQGKASPDRFQPHEDRSYNPMFTFSALELLVEMIRQEPELQVAVGTEPETYRRWAPKVQHAICFREVTWEQVPAIPICCSDAEQLSLADALHLYRRSRGLVEPPTLVAAGVRPVSTVARDEDHGWLTSYLPPYLCLYRVDRPAALGSILSAVLQEARGEDSGVADD